MASLILDRLKSFPACLVLLAAGLICYVNAINHPFVHDDVAFIVNNPHIAELDIRQIFGRLASPVEQSSIINVYYRPLLELYYRLVYHAFGMNPQAYHFLNILFHVLNGCLVFMLMGQVQPQKKVFNFFTALFFIIHPVQTEAVACISGISNLLYALFLLSGLYFYVKSLQENKSLFFLLSSLIFFCGLWVKEQMIVFPLLAFCLGLFVCGKKKQSFMKEIPNFLIWLVLWSAYLFLRHLFISRGLSTGIIFNGEFWLRVMSIPRTLTMYLQTVFFPFDLHYYRSIDILKNNIAGYAVFSAWLVAFFWLSKKLKSVERKIYFGGALWFILASLPTLNFIPLINEYSLILTAEHFLYVPLIGILVVIFTLVERYVFPLFERQKWIRVFIVGVTILNFTVITWSQNAYWRNEVVLFERTVKYEKIGRVYSLLGKAYIKDGRYREALVAFEKTLEIMVSYAEKTPVKEAKDFYMMFIRFTTLDIANTYSALSEKNKAVLYYQKALEMNPEDSQLRVFLKMYSEAK